MILTVYRSKIDRIFHRNFIDLVIEARTRSKYMNFIFLNDSYCPRSSSFLVAEIDEAQDQKHRSKTIDIYKNFINLVIDEQNKNLPSILLVGNRDDTIQVLSISDARTFQKRSNFSQEKFLQTWLSNQLKGNLCTCSQNFFASYIISLSLSQTRRQENLTYELDAARSKQKATREEDKEDS